MASACFLGIQKKQGSFIEHLTARLKHAIRLK
jgi:hypothetical protein